MSVSMKPGLKQGDKGEEVTGLQAYLHEFGYLGLPNVEPKGTNREAEPPPPIAVAGTFDDATRDALRAFQGRFGIPASGELDDKTLELMSEPRCGLADPRSDILKFRIASRWGRTDLTFAFENFTPDLRQEEVRTAITEAMAIWSAECPLTFREVPLDRSPNLKIRFHRDETWPDVFDGAGRILAHARYPEDGSIHFDEDETWTVALPTTGIDLVTVAVHELGHALGLDHSTVPGAIMQPIFRGPQRRLSPDDVEAIQFIYGERDQSPDARLLRSPLRAATQRSGRLSVFGASFAAGDGVLEVSQDGGGAWSRTAVPIPGTRIEGRLATVQNADGRLELFGRGLDDALWHTWQRDRPGGAWHAWESLGGRWTSSPAAAVNRDGRLEVFLRGTESQLWQRNQLWPGGPWGPGFGSLDGVITSEPSVVALPDGRLQVFARGADNGIWTRCQEAPGGAWTPWVPAGGGVFAGAPFAFVDVTGMVLVFAVGLDGKLWVVWGRGGDAPWSGPIPQGPDGADRLADGSRVDGAINAVGGLELFARFADGTLRHRWQLPAPAFWSSWETLGGPIRSDPTVAKRGGDGHLEVFALAAPLTAGGAPFPAIFHRAQTAGGWV